ncbi:MAG: class F sortase [Candidatus Dormibacteraeota bacterium]|nr:class F sortase [Candidatus Dormibacteraeota bacterium]
MKHWLSSGKAAWALMGVAGAGLFLMLAVGPGQIGRLAAPPASSAGAPGPGFETTVGRTPHPSEGRAGSWPQSLVIPSIAVQARIEAVGVTPDGALDVPRVPEDVGWYRDGPLPGAPGDTVVDGHLDSPKGPAVFWRLAQLRPGSSLEIVTGNGQILRFRVDRLDVYSVSHPPVDLFTSSGPPRLTLITCAGTWDGSDYSQRLLVTASQLLAVTKAG